MADVNATLIDLIQRAEASTARMGVQNPNRALLKEMSLAIVAMGQRIAQLQEKVADKPLIVLP